MKTANWNKKRMVVELLEHPTNPEAVGLHFSEDLAVNEVWSKEACRLMVESGEMKTYEEEDQPTAADVRSMFEHLWSRCTFDNW